MRLQIPRLQGGPSTWAAAREGGASSSGILRLGLGVPHSGQRAVPLAPAEVVGVLVRGRVGQQKPSTLRAGAEWAPSVGP